MINVGVVGATGYTGLELVKLLQRHKNVSIKKYIYRNLLNLTNSYIDPLIKLLKVEKYFTAQVSIIFIKQ